MNKCFPTARQCGRKTGMAKTVSSSRVLHGYLWRHTSHLKQEQTLFKDLRRQDIAMKKAETKKNVRHPK